MVATFRARQFVPQDLNPADLEQVTPFYEKLLSRPIHSRDDLERWLLDVSELSSVIIEYGSRRYIDKSCHTDDPAIEARFLQFSEEIEPTMKRLFFQLQKRFVASPHRKELDPRRLSMLGRQWEADVEVFREANVPLELQEIKLNNEYGKICGAQMVDFEGKQHTVQQMSKFEEQTDRDLRERAWVAAAERRFADRERIEAIFDQLLPLRAKMAENAGLDSYRSLIWKSYKRFDYTPQQCHDFANAIAETCMPIVRELDRQRKADLGVDVLRPWDGLVDQKGRPPLEPFKQDQIPMFIEKSRTIFERLSPELAEDFDSLRRRNNLDLESRKGKQPGGYQMSLVEAGEPFIFMNAVGVQRDVETLLHEGGHSFHFLASRHEPLMFLRGVPMEIAEVASMAMELLGADHFDVFYNEADAARAKRNMLEHIIRFLPWMAIVDSFQHWLYTHVGHTRQERAAQWLALLDRFTSSEMNWSGYEHIRAYLWQRQLHLFECPFYYVEYGIAQLGALQIWLKSRQDPGKALSNYRAALALGSTRPVPELFATAGVRFDFSASTLLPLMAALREELAELPA